MRYAQFSQNSIRSAIKTLLCVVNEHLNTQDRFITTPRYRNSSTHGSHRTNRIWRHRGR